MIGPAWNTFSAEYLRIIHSRGSIWWGSGRSLGERSGLMWNWKATFWSHEHRWNDPERVVEKWRAKRRWLRGKSWAFSSWKEKNPGRGGGRGNWRINLWNVHWILTKTYSNPFVSGKKGQDTGNSDEYQKSGGPTVVIHLKLGWCHLLTQSRHRALEMSMISPDVPLSMAELLKKDDRKSKSEVIPKTYSRKKELQNFTESSGENSNFDVIVLFTIEYF